MTFPNTRTPDYEMLVTGSKPATDGKELPQIRLALLGDCATQQFAPLLKSLLRRAGWKAEIFEADFNAIELTAYDPRSSLYAFNPDFIILLNCTQALRLEYYARQGSGADFLASTWEKMARIWRAIQANSSAVILQSNFVPPYERFFGNLDHKTLDAFYPVVTALNARLSEEVRNSAIFLNDVEAIASSVGRLTWFDERFWTLAKTFCAIDHLPLVAQNIADIVLAHRGKVVKCVVLDLDNTLWGGIIGDDGLNGIKISAHGDGEAFYLFQRFLLELSRRGIILAVCSKNDHANAIEPFVKHPEMVLKLDHITEFVANWEDKASNIRRIRQNLNIGFDSMVFLDDNPFERNLVRDLIPDMIVPELPEDPAAYVRAICDLNLFETASFSAEDLKRAEMYRVEAKRREEQSLYGSAEEFLETLDMRIAVARWDEFHLPRIAQLIQRSNQFNLTTRRLTETQCASLMQDTLHWTPLCASLSDRLGDHGLICVLTCEKTGDELAIRDWLMSCRVLKRTVEQYLMTEVFRIARESGLRRVTGEFIPTAKNAMVSDFFVQFGFREMFRDPDGRTQWALDVADFEAPVTYIQPVTDAKFMMAV